MCEVEIEEDPEFDAWYQAVVNGQLLLSVRSGDVTDILRFINNGGDIHNSHGYLLTQALIYHENWGMGSAAHVVVEQMFGPKGFPTLHVLKDLGYSPEQITVTLRETFLSPPKNTTVPVTIPEML